MAKNKPVWAIDIGNTSVKALQCRIGDEPGTIEALAFDYIEHSKILSQPGAEPGELVAESLETFLSRNNVRQSRVAISVSGQNTISRFLKLPPVDKKKLPDIIRLEAKQWLPFALDDVVWDYQPLIGGSMHGNTLVDSEIGMFAMKRDFAARALVPFERAGIPVDCIQSSPLALYNFAVFDQFDLTQLRDEDGGMKGFNNYTIILCIGTDSSDVVITNGVKIWVRNITIGGNNFTKSLTKGMKLTFSNAEHLKRNAAASQDPKAVLQVMRPVYNELLTEVNRSVEFYSSLDRKAKFNKVLVLGSSTKLPGLCLFLKQNFGYDVAPLKKYNKMVGDEVLSAPAFIENASSFGICYGLTLQMMGEAAIATNLIPSEVVARRVIAEKKPWLLAGAAALMLGLIVPFMSVSSAFTPLVSGLMNAAESAAKNVQSKSSTLNSEMSSAVSAYNSVDEIGGRLTENVEGRIRWPELYCVLQQALPQNRFGAITTGPLALQDRIYVTNIEVQKVEDLSVWWDMIKTKKVGTYILDEIELPDEEKAAAAASAEGDTDATDTAATPASAPSASSASSAPPAAAEVSEAGMGDLEATGIFRAKVPEGEGYIVQLSIYHYHNPRNGMTVKDDDGNVIDVKIDFSDVGPAYVRRTLLRNLRHNTVKLPSALSKQSFSDVNREVDVEDITMQEFGFSHPVLLEYDNPVRRTIIDPDALQKEVEKAILRERTTRITAVSQGKKPVATAGGPGTGRSDYMGGFDTGGLNTTLGNGGLGAYTGKQSVLTQLAASNSTGGGGMGPATTNVISMINLLRDDQKLEASKFETVVQIVWIPKTPTERAEAKAELEAAAAAAAGMPDDADADNSNNETDAGGVDASDTDNAVVPTPDDVSVTTDIAEPTVPIDAAEDNNAAAP